VVRTNPWIGASKRSSSSTAAGVLRGSSREIGCEVVLDGQVVEQLVDLRLHEPAQLGDRARREASADDLAQLVVQRGVGLEEVALADDVAEVVEVDAADGGERLPVATRALHVHEAQQRPEVTLGVVVHRRRSAQGRVDRIWSSWTAKSNGS